MTFDKQKKQVLTRLDKSKKGSIDKPILKLVNLINSKSDFYTSSSCSGRIFIMEITGKKDMNTWHLVSHKKVTFRQVKEAIESSPKKGLWIKQESFILHICCKDIDAAKLMLTVCHKAGLKRAGVIALGKRIMLEVFGTERMEAPVAEGGKLLIEDDYLKTLVKIANSKHEKNKERIIRLNKEIRNCSEN